MKLEEVGESVSENIRIVKLSEIVLTHGLSAFQYNLDAQRKFVIEMIGRVSLTMAAAELASIMETGMTRNRDMRFHPRFIEGLKAIYGTKGKE